MNFGGWRGLWWSPRWVSTWYEHPFQSSNGYIICVRGCIHGRLALDLEHVHDCMCPGFLVILVGGGGGGGG